MNTKKKNRHKDLACFISPNVLSEKKSVLSVILFLIL